MNCLFVVWGVVLFKGGVRKEAPSQTCSDLCLVGVWTVLFPCKADSLRVRGGGSCMCVCVHACVLTEEGHGRAGVTWLALHGLGRTSHFWLVFKRDKHPEYGPPCLAALLAEEVLITGLGSATSSLIP